MSVLCVLSVNKQCIVLQPFNSYFLIQLSLLQEAASLSMEAGLGGGRSLLQARGGYKERERERERQRRIKEKAGLYAPVEFKVE